jgi:hypothetical protein
MFTKNVVKILGRGQSVICTKMCPNKPWGPYNFLTNRQMQRFPRRRSSQGVKVITHPHIHVFMFCKGKTLDLLYFMRATFPAKFTLLRLIILFIILLLHCTKHLTKTPEFKVSRFVTP